MLVTFNCPHCNSELEIDAAEAGAHIDCPACSQECRTPVPRVGPGTTLGNFAIERRLGGGGMGDVYVARQLSMDRLVALKVLPQALTRKPSLIERFRHEVRMSARLEHPHVVTAFEAGEDFGYLYLAMSYVDGEDLRSRLKRLGTLPEREALTLARQIADALGYAWNTFRLLHRDVKPSNILIDRKDNARIMDLGISKCLLEDEDAELTVSGMLVGTPHYMSPEQATSGAELDCRADIYSLGATLYHVLTGTTPYEGQTAAEVLRQLGVKPVPPLRGLNSAVSEHCAKLVAKMMALQRDHRPASWEAVITDVDRVLAGREPLLLVGEAAVDSAGRSAPAPAEPTARPPSRTPATAGGPTRLPPALAPPVRDPSAAGRAGPAADSAEFRTPPRIDLRQRRGQRLLRQALWRIAMALALAGLCLAAYYGWRHGVRTLNVRRRALNLLSRQAGNARGDAVAPKPSAATLAAPLDATKPSASADAAPPTPVALDAAGERRLTAVLDQAIAESLAERAGYGAEILNRAARESVLAPVAADLHRAAALLAEGEREPALIRQSLSEDVGQPVALSTRTGVVRLKLLRVEGTVATGLRLQAGDSAVARQIRVALGDLTDEEVIGRLRRYVGQPAGDMLLALALLRAGRNHEARDPVSRLPVLLRDAFRRRLQTAEPAAAP
jgi:serine/threonine-protein kinase